MAENSRFWVTAPSGLVGDQVTGYSNTDLQEFNRITFMTDPTKEGVMRGVLNALAVSGTVTNVTVATGYGMVYGLWYKNDLAFTISVTTPTVSTRIDRIVLRANLTSATYSGQVGYTVKAVKITQAEGIGTPPAVTQSGSVWEIPIATVSITTGGAITVTDERTFLRSPVQLTGDNWTSTVSYTGALTLSAAAPELQFQETDQSANEKLWGVIVNGKVMGLGVLSDDRSTRVNAILITRGTGATLTSIGLAANTSVTGTFSTSGAATLASASITAGATVGTTLAVSGATTMAALTTSGVASFTAGTLVVNGGATTNNGTMAITGAATLSTSLSVGTTLAVTGNTTLSAALSAGASTLASASITGAATVGTTLAVTGAATLSSTLAVTSNATVGGTLGVTGAFTVTSTASIAAGTMVVNGGAVTVNGTLTVTGTITGPLASGSVDNSELANMADSTIKGRASGAGTGAPTDLTAAQARAAMAVPLIRRGTISINTAASGSAADGSVAFGVTFAAAPIVSVTAETLSFLYANAKQGTITTTGFDIRLLNASSGTVGSGVATTIHWIAIEA